MTLRQKILLLGFVAIAGMFLALGLQYRSYTAQFRAIGMVTQNVKAIGALSHAVHELQIERGLTALNHSTADAQALAEQFGHTDSALSGLAGAGIRIADVRESLVRLREKAVAAPMDQLAIRDDYTQQIQRLIDEMDWLAGDANAADNADISAHHHLIATKEYLGQIRATLGYWTGQKRNDLQVLNSVIRLKGLCDEQLRKFMRDAPHELRETFAANLAGPEVKRAQQTVTQIVATGQLPQELDAPAWWSMVTENINQLKLIEDYSLKLIERKAEGKLAQLQNARRVEVAATLVVSLVVFLLALSATTSLLHALDRVLRSMDLISASQDFRCRIPADSPDEIGRISRSFNQLLDIAERLLKEKDYLATTDPLMGISNRLRFAQVLAEEISRKHRKEAPMALVIFDVDHFKRINDTYGHHGGDEVLKALANLVSASTRTTDLFARWGGEEFVLLLRDDDCHAAMVAAEKLRKQIANTDFPVVGKLTCSFGVATFEQGDTEECFVARADRALYAAKNGGRDQVICTSGAKGSCDGCSLISVQHDDGDPALPGTD